MKILNYVSLILLWSSVSVYANAQDGRIDPFKSIKGYEAQGYTNVENFKELANPPRGQCPGVIPACNGPAAAYMGQAWICKVKKIADCSKVSQDEQISMFSMIGWSKKNSPDDPADYPSSYTNIEWGGAAMNSLLNSAQAFTFKPESCYPVDKINNKYANQKQFQNKMAELQNLFLKNKNKTEGCDSCLMESINDAFNVSISQEGLKAAMQKTTFDEFLFKLIFNDCTKKIKVSPSPTVDVFPMPNQKVTKEVLADKIAEILAPDKPVLLGRLCLIPEKNGKGCTVGGSHTLVVTGYKKICKKEKKGNEEDCKQVLKVQNSWGEDWQKEYDGGWVDAKSLLSSIAESPLDVGTLSWYQ